MSTEPVYVLLSFEGDLRRPAELGWRVRGFYPDREAARAGAESLWRCGRVDGWEVFNTKILRCRECA